jgi:hypothetical protein
MATSGDEYKASLADRRALEAVGMASDKRD